MIQEFGAQEKSCRRAKRYLLLQPYGDSPGDDDCDGPWKGTDPAISNKLRTKKEQNLQDIRFGSVCDQRHWRFLQVRLRMIGEFYNKYFYGNVILSKIII